MLTRLIYNVVQATPSATAVARLDVSYQLLFRHVTLLILTWTFAAVSNTSNSLHKAMLFLLWEEETKPTSFHFHRARSSLPLPFQC
eukprot:m.211093 g.211093  ORF g.211093 m.211093 type:complete len:86 (+) comp17146_c1_seq60:1246-1503(+)